LSGIKRNHRGLGPVNSVGEERRSIPERPNTGSQKKLCELGRCHDGETNHPISTGPSQIGQIPGHRKSCVSWGVVMMEKPVTRSPQVHPREAKYRVTEKAV